jgi:hypothetical protein
MDDIQSKFDNLKHWITANGGHISNIILTCGQYGRSYTAAAEIQPNDNLVSIPKSLWIDENSSNVKHLAELSSCEKIMISLLLELRKGRESFYFPFIDLLPSYEEFETHPLVEVDFNLDSLKIEKWKVICPGFADNIISLIDFYHRHYQHVTSYIEITKEEFKYVYLLYLTRNWHKFVPGADLFQHRRYKSLKGYNEDDNFKISSGDSYSIGEDVYINYGNKTNVELMFQYGFKTDIDFIPVYIPNFECDESLELTPLGPNRELTRNLERLFNDDMKAIEFLLSYISEWKRDSFSISMEQCDEMLKKLDDDSIIMRQLLEVGLQNHSIADYNIKLIRSIL